MLDAVRNLAIVRHVRGTGWQPDLVRMPVFGKDRNPACQLVARAGHLSRVRAVFWFMTDRVIVKARRLYRQPVGVLPGPG